MPTKGALMQRRNISIILANVLDHFDANLYGFIAPIMAPLFFPKQEPIIQLILAYSFLATSSITRPIGVLIFGWFVTRYDPWKILCITLAGVGVTTFMVGCIPTFSSVGYYSAVILLCVRIIGGVFAAGEKTIASFYVLENQSNKHAMTSNAWMESSIILGCALASWTATYINEGTWRIPFWCGGMLALYAVLLRFRGNIVSVTLDKNDSRIHKDKKPPIRSILTVIFSGGLYYVTYDLSFIFMNTFVPLITNITRETMMYWNTTLLLFDIVLFIPISYLVWNRDVKKIKRLSALMLALPAVPLFYFMQDASLFYVLFVRFWIVMWGIVFSCVMNVQLLSLFPHKSKYLWIGLGSTAGTILIGRSTSALCLWGWHATHLAAMPGIYLFVVAMAVWLLTKKGKCVDKSVENS
jgi:MFS family permease